MISFFYSSYLFPFFTPYTISYYLFLSHITLSFVHQANIRSLIYMLHRSCGHHHSQLSWRPDTSSDGTSCLRARVLTFPRKSNNIQQKFMFMRQSNDSIPISSKKLMFSISVCEEHQTNMIVILVIILWSWRLFDEKEQQSKQSSGWQKWGVQGYWPSSITENTRNTTSNKLPKNGRLSQAIIVGSSLWHCVSLWCSVRLGHIMPHYSHMEMWPR